MEIACFIVIICLYFGWIEAQEKMKKARDDRNQIHSDTYWRG